MEMVPVQKNIMRFAMTDNDNASILPLILSFCSPLPVVDHVMVAVTLSDGLPTLALPTPNPKA
jgi:hypothetical protein